MWSALALTLVVVAYNNVVNRWEPFHRGAYVPANLAFTLSIAFIGVTTLDLRSAQLGLQIDLVDGAAPLAAVAVFALALVVLVRSRHAHRIADRRVAGLHGWGLAYHVLVRIPLGTGVTEEVVFRGVLFAAWRETGASVIAASLCASAAFGLWHVAPTIIGIRANDPVASHRKLTIGVIGAVVLTMIAGLGFTWLRVVTGGLLAPIVIHAGVNSVGALAAVMAGRRTETGPGPT